MSGWSDDVGQGKMRIKGTVCFCMHMHSSFSSSFQSTSVFPAFVACNAGSEICVARLSRVFLVLLCRH